MFLSYIEGDSQSSPMKINENMNPYAIRGTQIQVNFNYLQGFFFRFENKKYLTNQVLTGHTSEPNYLGFLKKNTVLVLEDAGASGISAHTSSFCFLFLKG